MPRYIKQRTTIDGYEFQIQNYELGVLFPVKEEQEVDRFACFERPPRKYSTDDLPWVSEDNSERIVAHKMPLVSHRCKRNLLYFLHIEQLMNDNFCLTEVIHLPIAIVGYISSRRYHAHLYYDYQ